MKKMTLESEIKEWNRHVKALKAKGQKPHPLMVKVHEARLVWLKK